MIEDYVMEKKSQGKARSTIKTPISALELFCDANDIIINWKKIHRFLPAQKKQSGSKAYSTEQVQKMLQATTDLRNKAIIHFIASTGVRIGALSELKIKHVQNMPHDCKVVTIYSDDIEEYFTFLTPEASKALDDYLDKRSHDGENLDPEHPLFRQNYAIGMAKPKSLVKVSIQAIIDRILRRAGLRFGRDGTRREIQLDHGFRKRWNTIVKTTDGINIILAEKMFGHSTPTLPLDETYVDVSIEKLFDEFKKVIPELTINSEQRQQFEIKKQEEKISTLTITQKEKVQQEEKMKNMEERLNFLSDSQFAMISTIQEMSKKDKKTMKKFISIYEKDFKNTSDFENS